MRLVDPICSSKHSTNTAPHHLDDARCAGQKRSACCCSIVKQGRGVFPTETIDARFHLRKVWSWAIYKRASAPSSLAWRFHRRMSNRGRSYWHARALREGRGRRSERRRLLAMAYLDEQIISLAFLSARAGRCFDKSDRRSRSNPSSLAAFESNGASL